MRRETRDKQAENLKMTEADHQLPDTINPNNFPAKLWRMVNNPANSAICWNYSGEVIVIDQLLFEQLILSPDCTNNEDNCDTFKTTHFSSFVRQLNLYGFKKVDLASTSHVFMTSPERRSTIHHFHNLNFRRNSPALLVNLKRLTVDNKAKIDSGIDVKCRAPSKYQRSDGDDSNFENLLMEGGASSGGRRFEDKNSLEKLLMEGCSSSVVKGRKDSPHPYRKLPMPPHEGTPVPPYHLHPMGHPYTAKLSTPHQQGVGCGVYGNPNFTGIHYSPACQCYPPGLMALPHGIQPGPFMPIGFFPACYPMMDLGRDCQGPDSRGKNKQGMKKADINLDTVFQIADDVMLTQPNNNLIKIEVLEKAFTSDDHTSDPVQTPKEALSEGTNEELDRSEVIQVEVSNTSDSESCQG